MSLPGGVEAGLGIGLGLEHGRDGVRPQWLSQGRPSRSSSDVAVGSGVQMQERDIGLGMAYGGSGAGYESGEQVGMRGYRGTP